MKEEIDLNEVVNDQTNNDNVLKLENSSFNLPLRITCFTSDKELITFIRNVEKLVRSSIEYKYWLSYIKETLGQNECALTKEKLSECHLEVHHHPISLFTVCKSVINDLISKEQSFSTFDISTNIIELHYQNKIGYILLLSDLHKKYHDGFQRLPIEFVHGDFKYLMNNYTIDDDELTRIYELCNTKIEDCKIPWQRDKYPGIEDHVDEVFTEQLSGKDVKKINSH